MSDTSLSFTEVVVGEPGPSATFSSILNTWAHIAVSRSSGTTKLFLNGSQVASAAQTTNFNNTSYPVYIATSPAETYLPAYISNLRILKGTGLYTASFSAPTTPLTAIANTSLLICQDAVAKDNSSNNFTVNANASPTLSLNNPFTVNRTYSKVTQNLAALEYYTEITNTNATAFSYFPVTGQPRTLLNWISSFGVTGNSNNNNTGNWTNGYSTVSATATPIASNNYFSSGTMKLIQGDQSSDPLDWTVFYFKGSFGDFDGNADAANSAWFGGENTTNGGSNGGTVTVGRIWGFNANLGWKLLYQMPLVGTGTYNHTSGNYFTAGGTVSSGYGKRDTYDSLSIMYVGFSVGTS
jgi:hypothetical protein